MTVGNSNDCRVPLHVCKCCIAQALGAQNCWTVSIPPIKKGCLSTCHVPLQPRQMSAVFPQCYYSLLLGDIPFPVERISFSKPCLVLPIIFISLLKCLWCWT